MNTTRNICLALVVATGALASAGMMSAANAATAQDLDKDSQQALATLTQSNSLAAKLAHTAKATLVFPNIVKAGFIFGAGYGEGELLKGTKIDGYYNSFTGSWGLQAGAQSYGYIVFLMTKKAEHYVHDSHGWEIGVGPTVVVVDEGVAKNLTTSTLKDDAYAFIFSQQGLMAGVSIEGTKISSIKR
ncbi:lipid-binding SYLF domain-containing protein [Telmatospirillum sp.]|uniref:lipid-binding SYLF domain-containing protein n=1 Tax=Telmatospirillum sp. TaxID=2079197 RepID=UPI002848779F|nr:lipid-binding SYLF domain-containing protein [Telmatospirillum sp.]MDR3440527.1 lipid-binding SYLF domain-containing protein [Telmatospirillum sp.]